MPTGQFRVGGAVLGAVADEAHSSILLPITGVHHVHVQPSNTCAQRVIRGVAAAALDLGPHSLPAQAHEQCHAWCLSAHSHAPSSG